MSNQKKMRTLALAVAVCCTTSMAPGMVYAESVQTIGSTAELTKSNSAVKLNKKEVTLQVGEKTELTVKNGTKKVTDVKWKSKNPKIASVDKNGSVTAKKKGTAKITAVVDNKQLVCMVKVKQEKVKSITLDKMIVLASGDTETLKPVCKPAKALSGKKITWKSDDTSVVKVTNGSVKAKEGGVTVVHASIDGKKASCQIGVIEELAMEEGDKLKLSMENNQDYQMGIQINDGDDEKEWREILEEELLEVEWASDDEDIVEVDEEGKLTLNEAGEATITVSVGDLEAECTVIVEDDGDASDADEEDTNKKDTDDEDADEEDSDDEDSEDEDSDDEDSEDEDSNEEEDSDDEDSNEEDSDNEDSEEENTVEKSTNNQNDKSTANDTWKWMWR